MHNRLQATNNLMANSVASSLSNGPLLGNPGDVDNCLAQSVSAMDCGDSIINSTTLTIAQGRSNIPMNVSAMHRQNSFK